ncbi:hypothetical protein AOLI_G00003290 [Acnodon oligacanthus]
MLCVMLVAETALIHICGVHSELANRLTRDKHMPANKMAAKVVHSRVREGRCGREVRISLAFIRAVLWNNRHRNRKQQLQVLHRYLLYDEASWKKKSGRRGVKGPRSRETVRCLWSVLGLCHTVKGL